MLSCSNSGYPPLTGSVTIAGQKIRKRIVAGPLLYSTNCWFAHQVATLYRQGTHFVWCSEYFDPATAPPGSAASAIAPSSSPRGIYDALHGDCAREDSHSSLINGYRKKFRALAAQWLSAEEITKTQHDEIVAAVKSPSWKIWWPVLFVIPRQTIESADRLIQVSRKQRAAYGPELQIVDLRPHEFDMIEVK